ncbi:type IV pilin [Methanococcoides sp. SA1]|nr:type IV pilin [Methanococcoides sp. SA1]
MKRVNKKGVSPVIASVLMILMVMVLAAIIFLWARGFIGEQIEKFGEPIENYCSQVDFAVSRYGSELEILNRGNVDIRSLDVKKVRGGDSEFTQFPFQVDAGGSAMEYVTLDMKDGRVPEEIFVYPILVGNVKGENKNNIFTCLDAGVKL